MIFSLRTLISALFLTLSVTACVADPVAVPPGAAFPSPENVGREDLKAAWTQYGPMGLLEARAVVEGADCPEIVIDLLKQPMQRRAEGNSNFLTICSAVIPAGTKQAGFAFIKSKTPRPHSGAGAGALREWYIKETGVIPPDDLKDVGAWIAWQGKLRAAFHYDVVPLALPAAEPQRIVVLGDTGCRIKGKKLQACSDPVAWPFPGLAAAAARLKPDLVIHVGDYLYREQACPAEFIGCQGTPFGDNWPTWDADFFAPAKPLLAAAPWVIVRGNHEDCQRAGPGFLRLLGTTAYDPAAACSEHLAPYSIPLAGLNLVVSDNADAPEKELVDKRVPVYRAEFEALAKEPSPSWWLMHRPIWGLVTGPLGLPAGGNLNLMAAVGEAGIAAPVSLMLAGHIHTFEAINYAGKPVPPQIVAGFGGDYLDPTPANLRGGIFQGSYGVSVKDGLSIGGFGFLLMTKTGADWSVDVYDWQGRIERQCRFHSGRVDCPVPAKRRR